MNQLIDTQLGQYQLKEVIRRGGMSMVYKAYQPSLDRFVAVKVLAHASDMQFSERFKREARAIAQLQHPNILPVYDYGEQDGLLYLVMRYVENGVTLADMLGQPLVAPAAMRLIGHVLEALEYAHQRGIIHRDIKPANVLMPSPTWPMLADFGIAKLLNDVEQRLTTPGLIVGTVAYMAPEQATGRAVDARTDIYATGIMLYEMVTGRVPFDSDTPMGMLTQQAYEAPPPPRTFNPDLSPLVEAVLLRAMAKDPNARYQTAAEMARELEHMAGMLDQPQNVEQESDLYSSGMRAFEEGQWELAVGFFTRLVVMAPEHEEAADLLVAAREARERAKTEAHKQIELVRQRQQQSTIQKAAALAAPPPEPQRAPTSSSVPATATRQPATSEATVAAVPDARPVSPPTAPTPEPAQPADRRRSVWPWVLGAVLGLVVVGLVLFRVLSPPATTGGEPTAVPSVAATIATKPTAAAATTAPVVESTAVPTVEPTAAPILAPAPAPLGELVFQDDFSDIQGQAARTGLEDDQQNNEFSRGFHAPGVYHFQPKLRDARWVVLPRVAFGEFSILAEVWDNSDDRAGEVAQGLIVRARDEAHFYAVLLDSRQGRYTVRKQDGKDNWADLIAWTPSAAIKQADAHNQLRVDGQGGDFSIYLNDVKLDSFSDDSFAYGMLGMIVANGDADQPHIHFDNVSIWSSDPPVVDTELPPTRETPAGQMLLIPGSEFIMGSTLRSDERVHMVALKSFYIDRTEVTNEAYKRCVAAGACQPPGDISSISHPTYYDNSQFATFPVLHVNWEQARNYCGWAEKRLPTEAEWEKAASWHAETSRKSLWPWGNSFDPALVNTSETGVGDTTAAGTYAPELNGTVDMGGNVSEWTSSLYQPYPYVPNDGREDPQASGDRVFRGGSWAQTKGKATGVFRQGTAPTNEFREIGFRCADDP